MITSVKLLAAHSFQCSPARCWPLMQGHMAGSCSTCPPGLPRPSLLLSRLVGPSPCWHMGLFLTRCIISHFPLLNFRRFLLAHFSSFLRTLRLALKPSDDISCSSQFCAKCELAEASFCPTVKSLMEILNSIVAQSLGKPPVTALQMDFVTLITTPLNQQFCQISVCLTVHIPSL